MVAEVRTASILSLRFCLGDESPSRFIQEISFLSQKHDKTKPAASAWTTNRETPNHSPCRFRPSVYGSTPSMKNEGDPQPFESLLGFCHVTLGQHLESARFSVVGEETIDLHLQLIIPQP